MANPQANQLCATLAPSPATCHRHAAAAAAGLPARFRAGLERARNCSSTPTMMLASIVSRNMMNSATTLNMSLAEVILLGCWCCKRQRPRSPAARQQSLQTGMQEGRFLTVKLRLHCFYC